MTNKNKEALTYAHGNRYIINGVEYVPALEARAVDVECQDCGWSTSHFKKQPEQALALHKEKFCEARKPIDWDGLRKTPQQVEEQHSQEHGDYWQAWRHGWNTAVDHIKTIVEGEE